MEDETQAIPPLISDDPDRTFCISDQEKAFLSGLRGALASREHSWNNTASAIFKDRCRKCRRMPGLVKPALLTATDALDLTPRQEPQTNFDERCFLVGTLSIETSATMRSTSSGGRASEGPARAVFTVDYHGSDDGIDGKAELTPQSFIVEIAGRFDRSLFGVPILVPVGAAVYHPLQSYTKRVARSVVRRALRKVTEGRAEGFLHLDASQCLPLVCLPDTPLPPLSAGEAASASLCGEVISVGPVLKLKTSIDKTDGERLSYVVCVRLRHPRGPDDVSSRATVLFLGTRSLQWRYVLTPGSGRYATTHLVPKMMTLDQGDDGHRYSIYHSTPHTTCYRLAENADIDSTDDGLRNPPPIVDVLSPLPAASGAPNASIFQSSLGAAATPMNAARAFVGSVPHMTLSMGIMMAFSQWPGAPAQPQNEGGEGEGECIMEGDGPVALPPSELHSCSGVVVDGYLGWGAYMLAGGMRLFLHQWGASETLHGTILKRGTKLTVHGAHLITKAMPGRSSRVEYAVALCPLSTLLVDHTDRTTEAPAGGEAALCFQLLPHTPGSTSHDEPPPCPSNICWLHFSLALDWTRKLPPRFIRAMGATPADLAKPLVDRIVNSCLSPPPPFSHRSMLTHQCPADPCCPMLGSDIWEMPLMTEIDVLVSSIARLVMALRQRGRAGAVVEALGSLHEDAGAAPVCMESLREAHGRVKAAAGDMDVEVVAPSSSPPLTHAVPYRWPCLADVSDSLLVKMAPNSHLTLKLPSPPSQPPTPPPEHRQPSGMFITVTRHDPASDGPLFMDRPLPRQSIHLQRSAAVTMERKSMALCFVDGMRGVGGVMQPAQDRQVRITEKGDGRDGAPESVLVVQHDWRGGLSGKVTFLSDSSMTTPLVLSDGGSGVNVVDLFFDGRPPLVPWGQSGIRRMRRDPLAGGVKVGGESALQEDEQTETGAAAAAAAVGAGREKSAPGDQQPGSTWPPPVAIQLDKCSVVMAVPAPPRPPTSPAVTHKSGTWWPLSGVLGLVAQPDAVTFMAAGKESLELPDTEMRGVLLFVTHKECWADEAHGEGDGRTVIVFQRLTSADVERGQGHVWSGREATDVPVHIYWATQPPCFCVLAWTDNEQPSPSPSLSPSRISMQLHLSTMLPDIPMNGAFMVPLPIPLPPTSNQPQCPLLCTPHLQLTIGSGDNRYNGTFTRSLLYRLADMAAREYLDGYAPLVVGSVSAVHEVVERVPTGRFTEVSLEGCMVVDVMVVRLADENEDGLDAATSTPCLIIRVAFPESRSVLGVGWLDVWVPSAHFGRFSLIQPGQIWDFRSLAAWRHITTTTPTRQQHAPTPKIRFYTLPNPEAPSAPPASSFTRDLPGFVVDWLQRQGGMREDDYKRHLNLVGRITYSPRAASGLSYKPPCVWHTALGVSSRTEAIARGWTEPDDAGADATAACPSVFRVDPGYYRHRYVMAPTGLIARKHAGGGAAGQLVCGGEKAVLTSEEQGRLWCVWEMAKLSGGVPLAGLTAPQTLARCPLNESEVRLFVGSLIATLTVRVSAVCPLCGARLLTTQQPLPYSCSGGCTTTTNMQVSPCPALTLLGIFEDSASGVTLPLLLHNDAVLTLLTYAPPPPPDPPAPAVKRHKTTDTSSNTSSKTAAAAGGSGSSHQQKRQPQGESPSLSTCLLDAAKDTIAMGGEVAIYDALAAGHGNRHEAYSRDTGSGAVSHLREFVRVPPAPVAHMCVEGRLRHVVKAKREDGGLLVLEGVFWQRLRVEGEVERLMREVEG
ncbi:unnamed protein product [Vitrella brassicaformis CCMP3155]|uniref:Uncharacterized protein n=1 Tax=Vitrella brassicaformis (strain CCMP3155) TaxID=1169540 RepID=A0A0G4FQL4_VITBC|nr:unnamed protein product [Vitrella brassicaformis CCMP3155]|eukprot:CEM16740.1 unnamed protein product [Vitrella brassicaformis CCMP3155]